LAYAPAQAQVSPDPRQAVTGSYKMETRHTQVLFSILHAGLTDYYGWFGKVSGALIFDAHEPQKSSVDVSIDTGSVNLKAPELIGEVTAKAVFDTADFPQATFKSTSVVRTGPTSGTVTGDLTIKGITKPVTFAVTFKGASGNQIAFHADAVIKRSDYDMTTMRWASFVGDDVHLIIEALFQQSKP
ncbi:MAG TPA: YceI family protein, partial [Rhizomicrobium sp.]